MARAIDQSIRLRRSRRPNRFVHYLVAILAARCLASGQVVRGESLFESMPIDSGTLRNDSNESRVIFSTVVTSPGAKWIRLRFRQVSFLGHSASGDAAFIRMTGIADGGVQQLNGEHLRQWRYASAFFNGESVLVELIAPAHAGPSRVFIDGATIPDDEPQPHSLCGTDDRIPSSDPRIGRTQPVGCTAWMFDDCNRCLLTAGHCADAIGERVEVVEFNVPLSNANGTKQHPPPEDQYAVDLSSIQFLSNGAGNDWAYFGCFPNSNTNLFPDAAQGSHFGTTTPPPLVTGQTFRVTGHGTVTAPISPTWYMTQLTHTGLYASLSGTTLFYQVDTTDGNSGSPVIDEASGRAVAIHAQAGCAEAQGGNRGTALNHPSLVAAIAAPRGVCRPSLNFIFPSGLPALLNPNGGTLIQLEVTPRGCTSPQTGTAMIHYDSGNGFLSVPMTQTSPNVYQFIMPGFSCSTSVKYYFSSLSTSSAEYRYPASGSAAPLVAVAADFTATVFDDDFELDRGWTVQNVTLADGAWERGVPAGDGTNGDPTSDFDGSGKCYVTDNAIGNSDVDFGPTRLISPRWDLTGMTNPRLSYARWFSHINGTPPPPPAQDTDSLDVEVSNDDGANWVLVERTTSSSQWTVRTIEIDDYVLLSAQIRVRFSVADFPNNSQTEAAIDAVSVIDYRCNPGPACTKADVNNDGVRDGRDVAALVQALISPPPVGSGAFCASDMNDNGVLDAAADVLLFVECVVGGSCP